MMVSTDGHRRFSIASTLVAGALVFAGAAPARAQSVAADGRWQGWIGCWQQTMEPTDAGTPPAVSLDGTQAPLLCVIPAAGTSAVDIVTVADGKVATRDHIEATGQQRPTTKEGCTGVETAQWSADSRRVYLRSEYACQGGPKRTASGLLAMSSTGDLLSVEGVTAGGHRGVHALRYRPTSNPSTLPSDIGAAIQGHSLAASAVRTAAGAPLTTADVIDASRHLDAPVVSAWLIEQGQRFSLSAKQLVQLADAGVPGSVTDMMVALAYPKVFALDRSAGQGELRPQQDARIADYANGANRIYVPMAYDGYYSPFGWNSYFSPFGFNSYYSPYGGYGYGYGLGYGGYNGYGLPVIIIKNPANNPPPPHGRVVNGRGYTQGGGTASSGPERSSTAAGSSGASASPPAASSAPARTAKPRP